MTMRVGVLAKKLGMTRRFCEESGTIVPMTLLFVDACVIVAQKTLEKHGYSALQVGMEKRALSSLDKAQRGYFAKISDLEEGRRYLKEFRVSAEHMLDAGTTLSADHFEKGGYVDVTSTSLGKGFAGPMKRHNFGGLRASHGVSVSHRSHGSTGQRSFPGRVFKNKKMAGHMGARRTSVQSLKVVLVSPEEAVIGVLGGVPGHVGSCVVVRDAVKKRLMHKNAQGEAA